MQCKVFYSWQSDLPNSTNRSFINQALDNVAKKIDKDDSIEITPVIDRDTSGVPGSPDISQTIFQKIDEAHVFVCDVSIINKADASRLTPNPNVLVELGYALKVLGSEKVVLIANTAFGGPELLPFDLKMRRVLTYHFDSDSSEKAEIRRIFESRLEANLRSVFSSISFDTQGSDHCADLSHKAQEAVEENLPTQVVKVRKFMNTFREELVNLAPPFPAIQLPEPADEILLASINSTLTLLLSYLDLCKSIALADAMEAAKALLHELALLLPNYRIPNDFSGQCVPVRRDFHRFLGYELLVSFCAFLLRERRWAILKEAMHDDFYVENGNYGAPSLVKIDAFTDYVELLEFRNKRLNLKQISVHAYVLNERYSTAIIRERLTMQEFMEADFLLQICFGKDWKAWSCVYLGEITTLKFLIEAARRKNALILCDLFSCGTIDDLKKQVEEGRNNVHRLFAGRSIFFRPLSNFSVDDIGKLS